MKNARNRDAQDGLKTVVTNTVKSGDPVLGWGSLPGVAKQDADTDGNVVILRNATVLLSTLGNDGAPAAIAAGDALFLSADSAVLNSNAAGTRFGIATEAVASGVTATILVLVD